jgi:hypothetical protein
MEQELKHGDKVLFKHRDGTPFVEGKFIGLSSADPNQAVIEYMNCMMSSLCYTDCNIRWILRIGW